MIEAWVDVMIKVCRCYDRSVCCGIIVIAMNRMSVSSMPMVCPIEMGIPAGLRLISVLSFVLRISSLDSGIRFPYICNRPPWLTDDLQVTYRWLAGDLQITYRWLTGDLQVTYRWLTDNSRTLSLSMVKVITHNAASTRYNCRAEAKTSTRYNCGAVTAGL